MKYEMVPVIDIYELHDEIEKEFPDVDFEPRRLDGGLGSILFGDNYCNDCYKRFSFEDGPMDYNYTPHETDLEYNYQREREITIYNYAVAILEKHFPNHKEVLIDLSW